MGTPMKGFFDRADMVFEVTTPATPAATQGISAEAPIPSTEVVPIDEGTYTERVNKTAPFPTETLTPQEVVIPPVVAQTEVTYSAAPLVSSTSDPFAALSQAMKDGSSLVVTPYSILSSATRGLDVDLSFKGFEDVLEDPNDKPKMKKRVSNFEKEESA